MLAFGLSQRQIIPLLDIVVCSTECTFDTFHHVQIAKRQAVVNPENTFFSVKRFIGRQMSEVKDESKQVPLPCTQTS